MTKLLIRLFVFVTVLLGGAGISFASDCASDPNECTPKDLCEVATEMSDGNKLWSSAATSREHVSFAQELGMNCGVVKLKDPCETDPNECKIKQLCEKATIEKDVTKGWNSEADAYVVVAKEYGLECGVVAELKAEVDKCKDGDTKSVKCRPIPIVPSDEETQVSRSCTPNNPKACSDITVCKQATAGTKEHKRWDATPKFFASVSEAERRGLTCGVAETKYKLKSYRTYKRTSGEFKGDVSIYDASRQKGTDRLYSKRDGWARFWTDYDKDKDYKLYSNTNNVLPALRSAFKQKSKSERLKIQRNLKNKRLYDSTIDGLWGRNTLVALTDYSSKRLRTIRLKDPQIVATLMDQILRDSSSGTVALASSEVINEVYAHLENANKLEVKSDAFASSFKKQTKLKRQQIQYALRKLGHYRF